MNKFWIITAIISFFLYISIPIAFYKKSHKRKLQHIKNKLLITSFILSGLFSISLIVLDCWLISYVNNNATYFGLQPEGLFGLNMCAILPILGLNVTVFILSLKEYLNGRNNKWII